MKIEKFITIPWEDFGKMDLEELVPLLKDMSTKANRRLNSRAKKNIRDLDTPAYGTWVKTGSIPFGNRPVYDEKGIQTGYKPVNTSRRHETITELKRIQNFLKSKTSTVEGYEKLVAEMEGRTFGLKGRLTSLRARKFAEGLLLMKGLDLSRENIDAMEEVIHMFSLPDGSLREYWRRFNRLMEEYGWISDKALLAARVDQKIRGTEDDKRLLTEDIFSSITKFRDRLKDMKNNHQDHFDLVMDEIEEYFNIGKNFTYADLYEAAQKERQRWLRSQRRRKK